MLFSSSSAEGVIRGPFSQTKTHERLRGKRQEQPGLEMLTAAKMQKWQNTNCGRLARVVFDKVLVLDWKSLKVRPPSLLIITVVDANY